MSVRARVYLFFYVYVSSTEDDVNAAPRESVWSDVRAGVGVGVGPDNNLPRKTNNTFFSWQCVGGKFVAKMGGEKKKQKTALCNT